MGRLWPGYGKRGLILAGGAGDDAPQSLGRHDGDDTDSPWTYSPRLLAYSGMPQPVGDTHPELVRFGENVRELRKKRGLSQEELAAQAELDRTYMGGIERGERNLGLLNAARVARALGISLSKLCEGVEG